MPALNVVKRAVFIQRIKIMSVKIRDIKELLLDVKQIPLHEDYAEALTIGFNKAIDLQGKRSIGLNRNKLIEIIKEKWNTHEGWVLMADAIIANESKLLEVKPSLILPPISDASK